MEKVKVKVAKPFMFNGLFVKPGDEVEMNEERAVNHMRAGDLERNEEVISKIKARREASANAALADAKGEW